MASEMNVIALSLARSPSTGLGSLEPAECTENNFGHGFRFAKHTDYTEVYQEILIGSLE
jgi:hypothetical protein